ncbi:type II toxin-antitoxin system PemK/MazF family toxin [Streptomyces sp. NPDC059874]|uniref:type II toxin-antitoxin system PemK/MazF family toxin n=1 Tax=Streptomyces sp. NPDC059874 TaxID=3346983 RepID=UPI003652F2F5
MRRGEVWWVEFDERRPAVLLSGDSASGIRAMQVVAPAGVDISGLGVEVAVGAMEGLPFEGVLRVAFPRPGFTPCTWLTTVSRDDLIEPAGVLPSAKLSEIEDAIQLTEQASEWTPATTAKLSDIRDALRLSGGEQGPGAALDDHEQAQQRVSELPLVPGGLG